MPVTWNGQKQQQGSVTGENKDAGARKDVRRLSRVIKKNGRRKGEQTQNTVFVPVHVNENAAKFAKKISDILGRRVVFFRSKQEVVPIGAVIHSHPSVIYINADNEVLPATILGHELTHLLVREQPGLYAELANLAKERFQGGSDAGYGVTKW